MNREGAKDYIREWCPYGKQDEIIKALSNSDEDCISRSHFDERVRVAGGMVEYELSDDFKDGVLTVLEMLKTEPSIQPKPKTDVLDKIRAEITTLQNRCYSLTKGTMCAFCKFECKYTAESEDKE